jgi:hypothetical protein
MLVKIVSSLLDLRVEIAGFMVVFSSIGPHQARRVPES